MNTTLAERDATIFALRRTGKSPSAIAKQMGCSERAVNNAIQRYLSKINREALLAAPEVLRMELERLDALQQSIWPYTQPRKVVLPDGTEAIAEPDLKAVQQVLSIMDRRSKLLGMDQIGVAITTDAVEAPVRVALAGAERAASIEEFDPKTASIEMLEIMGAAGILSEDIVNALMGKDEALPAAPPEPAELRIHDVIDAEVVE